ncbi:MAG: helix-turn-helix domain-containing protein [Clostridia bacterium]|nr:helix-turn-helix domain-containing protein [Clostridia bacterium]
MSEIGEKLVALRTGKCMTQEDLADSILVSRSLVSLWELGKRVPDYTNVVHLAKFFGVSESDIIGSEDYLYRSSGELAEFLKETEEFGQDKASSGREEDSREAIKKLLIGLNPKDRAIFTGRYYYAKTCKAIAAETGMKEPAVRVRLLRLRKKLKRLIDGGTEK